MGWIETGLDALLRLEVRSVEHARHQIALFDTDAVLAAQNAAYFDAQPQDFGTQFFGFFQVAAPIAVVEHQGVQVAIAGVKDIGYGQAEAFA